MRTRWPPRDSVVALLTSLLLGLGLAGLACDDDAGDPQIEGEGEGEEGEGEGEEGEGEGEGEGEEGEGEEGEGEEGEGEEGEGEEGEGEEGEGEGGACGAGAWAELPTLRFTPGGQRFLPLDPFLCDGQLQGEDIELHASGGGDLLNASIGAGHELWLSSLTGRSGDQTVTLSATLPGGGVQTTELQVQVQAGGGDCVSPSHFEFDLTGWNVTQAVLAGTFNGWGGEGLADAWPLEDPEGDEVWTLDRQIEAGSYQYKYVLTFVDGHTEWHADPNAPQVQDEGGNTNNLLEVADAGCLPRLRLDQHSSDGDRFQASLTLIDGEGGIDPASLALSLDHQALDASEWTLDGDQLSLALSPAAAGIHDLRVQASDQQGQSTVPLLLKFHVQVSTDWRDAVLYFVMTDRFVDGDPSNNGDRPDAMPEAASYRGGDFRGLQQKIEEGYFEALGVNAIWLSWPVDNPSGGEPGHIPTTDRCEGNLSNDPTREILFSGYHGYWPADLDRTEEHFGNLEDLQELVEAAHSRGIRILLDFTANHVHGSSPFFQDHEDEGYFHMPVEICADVGWNNKPITCWFTSFLPDLNYGNAAARRAVIDMGIAWVRRSGADGFRFDAVKHLEFEFIRELRRRLKEEVELTGIDFYVVGETFDGSPELIRDFVGPDLVHGQFNFPLNLKIIQAFAKQTEGLDAMHQRMLDIEGIYGPDALMSNFLGNHDIARFISMAGNQLWCNSGERTTNPWEVVSNQAAGWLAPPPPSEDESAHARLRMAFAYLMGLPGIPLIYYGDEFGMPGGGDPDNRRTMRFTGELNAQEEQTLATVRSLALARESSQALRRGALRGWFGDGETLAFSRVAGDDSAVIVLNRSGEERSFDISAADFGLSAGQSYRDALDGQEFTVAGGTLSVSVPALGVRVLTP